MEKYKVLREPKEAAPQVEVPPQVGVPHQGGAFEGEPINREHLAKIYPFAHIYSKVKEQIDKDEFYARY